MEGKKLAKKIINLNNRKFMKEEGMKGALDFDVGEFLDKTFITFRKTKNFNETIYKYRYSLLNFITNHHSRNTRDIYQEVKSLIFLVFVLFSLRK